MKNFMNHYNWISKLNKYPTIPSPRVITVTSSSINMESRRHCIVTRKRRTKYARNREEIRDFLRLAVYWNDQIRAIRSISLVMQFGHPTCCTTLELFCPYNDATSSHEEDAAWSQRRLDISNYGHLACNLLPTNWRFVQRYR